MSDRLDRLRAFDPRAVQLQDIVPDVCRRHYLLKFALVVLVIAVVTGGVGLYFQSDVAAALTDDQEQRIEGIATDQATTIEAFLDENRQSVRLISRQDEFRNGTDAEIHATLVDEYLSLSTEHEAIHYVNTDTGEILESSSSNAIGTTLQDRGYQWRVIGNQSTLSFDRPSDVVISEITVVSGTGQIAFASPVPGAEDRAIIIPVNAAAISNNFRNPINGSSTQVVSGAGTVQVDADTDDLATSYAAPDVLRRGLQGESGTTRHNGSVVAYAPVDGTNQLTSTADVGWVVLVHAPESNAFALKQQVANNIFIIIGVALLGFVLVGATIGRNTVSALDDLTSRAQQLRDGHLDTSVKTERIDEIGQLYGAFGEMRDSLDQQITEAKESEQRAQQARDEAEAAKEEAETARAEAEALTDHLQQKASAYSETLADAAAGDLTQRLDPNSESDAMTEIALAFNEMLADLEETVATIEAFATEVATKSEQMSAQSAEVQTTSEDVASAIERISHRADEQRDHLENVANEMDTLSQQVDEIATAASDVATLTEQTAADGTDGRQQVSQSLDDMGEIKTKTSAVVDDIEELDEEMVSIGDIVELINDIAEQTNMLALNASIEAARAGEAGSGFAVVADEIKQLAEQTSEATEDIEARIESVQSSTNNAVQDMQEMRSLVEDGIESVERNLDTLDEIVEQVQEANADVQSIDEATDTQATASQDVVSMIHDVEEMGQETSDDASEVSAATEEQTASIGQIASSAETLEDRSQELESLLDAFTVDRSSVSLDDQNQATDSSSVGTTD
jgi:methyl-accepting chemotaxis protein